MSIDNNLDEAIPKFENAEFNESVKLNDLKIEETIILAEEIKEGCVKGENVLHESDATKTEETDLEGIMKVDEEIEEECSKEENVLHLSDVMRTEETDLMGIMKIDEEIDLFKKGNSVKTRIESAILEKNIQIRSDNFDKETEPSKPSVTDYKVKIAEEKLQNTVDGDLSDEVMKSPKKSDVDETRNSELGTKADVRNVKSELIDVTDGDSNLQLKKEVPIDVNDPDNFVDILGNSQLTKRVLTKGLGRESRPTHGDYVRISYKAWNSRGIKFAEEIDSLVIGDGDMIQAFDLALCLSEKHEEFELVTDARFAYGVQGLYPDVQSNETLKYHIKLLEIEDAPDYGSFTYNDRVSAANRKRERGNYLYRREEFSYAVNSYSRAIKIIETDPDFKKSYNEPSKSELFEVFVKVTNNLAASQLKLENFDSVIETCDNILSYDPTNVKALFRKGKGLSLKASYDEAIIILKKAFELDNKNKLIVSEIQKCMKLKKAEDEVKLKIYRRMFGNSSDVPSSDVPTTIGGWKNTFYKYSPYVGAAFATGLSIFLATVAITKSKSA